MSTDCDYLVFALFAIVQDVLRRIIIHLVYWLKGTSFDCSFWYLIPNSVIRCSCFVLIFFQLLWTGDSSVSGLISLFSCSKLIWSPVLSIRFLVQHESGVNHTLEVSISLSLCIKSGVGGGLCWRAQTRDLRFG